jgi:hypothetical protein
MNPALVAALRQPAFHEPRESPRDPAMPGDRRLQLGGRLSN